MNMNDEFEKFMKTNSLTPPKALDDKILGQIYSKLNFSHKTIFIKLIVTQIFIGLITLTFCPQFNISLTNRYELFHYFHRTFGEHICTGICAFIFMGSGSLFANYLLSVGELNLIAKNKVLYSLSISAIFMSIFLMINPDIFLISAFIWITSATMTFIAFNQSSLTIKKMYYNY